MSGADELRKFAQDLGEVAADSQIQVRRVIQKGSLNIKNDLIAGIPGNSSWRGLKGSISYDTKYGNGTVEAEIGPDKARRGGPLGNLYYFGGSRGGGHGDLDGPLAREAPNLERELGKLVDGWAGELDGG